MLRVNIYLVCEDRSTLRTGAKNRLFAVLFPQSHSVNNNARIMIFLCDNLLEFRNGFETINSIKAVLKKDSIKPIPGLQNLIEGLASIAPDIQKNFHVSQLTIEFTSARWPNYQMH